MDFLDIRSWITWIHKGNEARIWDSFLLDQYIVLRLVGYKQIIGYTLRKKKKNWIKGRMQ